MSNGHSELVHSFFECFSAFTTNVEYFFLNCFIFTLQKTTRIRNAPAKLQAATIHVYDATKVLGINKKLAEKYIIDSDNLMGKCWTWFWDSNLWPKNFNEHFRLLSDMCEHNRLMAEKYGNADTVQCWKLAQLVATSIATATDSLDDEIFSQQIPFPKILLESL